MDVFVHDSLEIQVKLSTREFFSGHVVLVVHQVSQVPVTITDLCSSDHCVYVKCMGHNTDIYFVICTN